MATNTAHCQGCSTTLLNFNLITESNETATEFLIRHNILKVSEQDAPLCTSCNHRCSLSSDGVWWRCQRSRPLGKKKKGVKKCHFKTSVQKCSWLAEARLPKTKVLHLINLWLTHSPPRQQILIEQLQLSCETAVDWSSYCREICIDWCLENSEMLGGEGKVVEIDEAKFGQRKYHRGRIIDGQWILGGIERGSGKCFLVPVSARNRETLSSVIHEWVRPGTTIMTDCWKAYNNLSSEGFQHYTVNHSENFVDPESGAHTQNVERQWRDLRATIPTFGRRQDHFVGYLAEFQFKKAHKDTRNRLHHFLIHAAKCLP